MVKRDYFNEVIALAEANGRDDLVKFAEHELELLAKKNSGNRKPTAVQLKNEEIKTAILNTMAEKPNQMFTITELLKVAQPMFEDVELTNQKVSALVRALKEENKVERIEDKRKAYFQIA